MARPEVADSVKGLTISTFGGNPVTTTAAKAVIDFIEEQNLAANCAETGGLSARPAWRSCKSKHPLIGDVRGMGLHAGASNWWKTAQTKAPATAADRDGDGSGARKPPADRQGRHVRQRDPAFAAHEHCAAAMWTSSSGLLDKSLAACGAAVAGAR